MLIGSFCWTAVFGPFLRNEMRRRRRNATAGDRGGVAAVGAGDHDVRPGRPAVCRRRRNRRRRRRWRRHRHRRDVHAAVRGSSSRARPGGSRSGRSDSGSGFPCRRDAATLGRRCHRGGRRVPRRNNGGGSAGFPRRTHRCKARRAADRPCCFFGSPSRRSIPLLRRRPHQAPRAGRRSRKSPTEARNARLIAPVVVCCCSCLLVQRARAARRGTGRCACGAESPTAAPAVPRLRGGPRDDDVRCVRRVDGDARRGARPRAAHPVPSDTHEGAPAAR